MISRRRFLESFGLAVLAGSFAASGVQAVYLPLPGKPLPKDIKLGPRPTEEKVPAAVMARIEGLGYDLRRVRRKLQTIQDGAISGRWDDILDAAHWPLTVFVGNRKIVVRNARQFIKIFGYFAPMYLREIIATQRISNMLINAEGFMYGDGEVWVGSWCLNKECTSQSYGIKTLNLK